MKKDEAVEAFAHKLAREAADRGCLIEAGWLSMRYSVIDADASQVQLDEMRKAFFAGAQHVFASITSMLDEGEPTQGDLDRMDKLADELQRFVEELKAEVAATGETRQ